MSNYEEVKNILEEMLLELDERLAKISDDVQHKHDDPEKDFSEQATQNENDEVLDYLGNNARKESALIHQALQRIDHGDYGVCQVCGGPIKEERLKALPFADKCIACASVDEK